VTAQSVHEYDPDDPVEILHVLPSQFHEQFLAEYDAAVTSARAARALPCAAPSAAAVAIARRRALRSRVRRATACCPSTSTTPIELIRIFDIAWIG
jgi:hypothetical protein